MLQDSVVNQSPGETQPCSPASSNFDQENTGEYQLYNYLKTTTSYLTGTTSSYCETTSGDASPAKMCTGDCTTGSMVFNTFALEAYEDERYVIAEDGKLHHVTSNAVCVCLDADDDPCTADNCDEDRVFHTYSEMGGISAGSKIAMSPSGKFLLISDKENHKLRKINLKQIEGEYTDSPFMCYSNTDECVCKPGWKGEKCDVYRYGI